MSYEFLNCLRAHCVLVDNKKMAAGDRVTLTFSDILICNLLDQRLFIFFFGKSIDVIYLNVISLIL